MYTAIAIIFYLLCLFVFLQGARKKQRGLILVLAVLVSLGFWFMDFWGEKLWFDAVGYGDRFWRLELFRAGFIVAGGLALYILIWLLLRTLPSSKRPIKRYLPILGFIMGLLWGLSNWETFLLYFNRVNTGTVDPILGQDIGFYMFVLPFLERVLYLLVLALFISLVAAFLSMYLRITANSNFVQIQDFEDGKAARSVYALAGMLLVVLAYGVFLGRYQLMFSHSGAVAGPGWTDVNIRLPLIWVMVGLMLFMALVFWVPALRQRLYFAVNRRIQGAPTHRASILAGAAGLLFFYLIVLVGVPALFQELRVAPNEITFERPYIAHNIEFTRKAFGLDRIEEKEFPASETITPQLIKDHPGIFQNVRLWDYRALDAVYKQFQEIRLYYEFDDVDIDRYVINDTLRQVMISARELAPKNLPVQSQTFVNQRFKYTHGYGITLTTVSDFTEEGLPNLLIRDIPPKSKYPELEIKQPRLYYGTLTDEHVIVNSAEEEFDYPSGQENAYNRYDGPGGVLLNNWWKKFLYGYKFDGTRLLFSSYPTRESRIMFHRDIRQRVGMLAPFLEIDDDPYVVLGKDGGLYWMLDAFTTTNYYPYSEKFTDTELLTVQNNNVNQRFRYRTGTGLANINYLRNAVKAVVNAYTGQVDLYIFDEEDPIIKAWDKAFPGLLKPKSQMPDFLQDHVRYPADMLLAQGIMYAKYHMSDPTVFYNQEDLWIRATEKYYQDVKPVEPYYVMWQRSEEEDPEFVLMMPFTPKNRQVMIGWIAALCDGDNYGRFLAYKFPKEKRVLGPQQVETKIDQDSYLSGQLTLWDQRGSKVLRGNVLAIPVEETLIYVEPIYLQAETAAYPELRLVAVMHNDKLSYAESFEEALQGLFDDYDGTLLTGPGQVAATDSTGQVPAALQAVSGTANVQLRALAKQAQQAFDDYRQYTGSNELEKAGRALEQLQQILTQMAAQQPEDSEEAAPETPATALPQMQE